MESTARHSQLGPDEIIAEFQRRRRRFSKIFRWTIGIGVGGFAVGLLILHLLLRLDAPPYWLFGGIGVCALVLVLGAIYAPNVYRCPKCNRMVQVRDRFDSGHILLRDPAECPHCGVRLKPIGMGDDGNRSVTFGITFRRQR